MIVLDTNVLSELMRSEPNQQVLAWVDAQAASELVCAHVTGSLGVGFALVAACTVGASVRKFFGALMATRFG